MFVGSGGPVMGRSSPFLRTKHEDPLPLSRVGVWLPFERAELVELMVQISGSGIHPLGHRDFHHLII